MNEQEIVKFYKKIDGDWNSVIRRIIENRSLEKPLVNPFDSAEEYFNYLDDLFDRYDNVLKYHFQEMILNYYFSIKVIERNSEILYRLLWVISSMRLQPTQALRLEKQFLGNSLMSINKSNLHIFLLSALSDFSEFGIINKDNINSYIIKNINQIENKAFLSVSLRYLINNENYSDFFLCIENLIPKCTHSPISEILFSMIIEIANVYNSYWVVYQWVVDRWLALCEKFPKQIDVLRLQLMQHLNYDNVSIHTDMYILPIIGIINSRANQLPAILILDLLKMQKTKYLKETFNLGLYLSFNIDKLEVFEEYNSILVSYNLEGNEIIDITKLFVISKSDAFGISVNKELLDNLLLITDVNAPAVLVNERKINNLEPILL